MNTKISRRDFVKGIGLASGGLIIGLNINSCSVKKHYSYGGDRIIPNVWISLLTNGQTYLVVHRSEMGQGIRTSLAAVLADEMEADLSRVTIEQAIGDEKYGGQNTDGSRSVRNFFTTLRKAGATVRELLVIAGAKQMRVAKRHCYADNHYIYNRKDIWKDIVIDANRESGKIKGFKVHRVNKNSVLASLGLQKGDIIVAANNVELN